MLTKIEFGLKEWLILWPKVPWYLVVGSNSGGMWMIVSHESTLCLKQKINVLRFEYFYLVYNIWLFELSATVYIEKCQQ